MGVSMRLGFARGLRVEWRCSPAQAHFEFPAVGTETNVYSREYLGFIPLANFPIMVGLFFILLILFWPASEPGNVLPGRVI